MAIYGVPTPKISGEILSGLPDELAAMKLAQAKARKSDMITNLLNNVMGGQGGGGQNGSGGGDINKSIMLASLLGIKPVEANGNIYTGTGTFKVGESAEEKRQGETQSAINKKTGEKDVDVSSDLLKQAADLKKAKNLLSNLNEVITRNPDATGIHQGAMAKMHLSTDPDTASFITNSTQLQGIMGRVGSQRGGVGALNWAKGSKPNEFNQGAFNKSMIDANLSDLDNEYNRLNKLYKQKTGKDLNLDEIDENSNMAQQPNLPQLGQSGGLPAIGNAVQQGSAQQNEMSGGAGEKLLAKNLKLPSFNSPEDYKKWFIAQPLLVRNAIRQKLKNEAGT